eukprot:gene4701-8285_t
MEEDTDKELTKVEIQTDENIIQEEYITTILEDEDFVLPKRYIVEKIIGVGSYSSVISAYDTKLKKKVAIKKNIAVFPYEDEEEYHRLEIRIIREIKTLLHCKHPSIIEIIDLILPQNFDTWTDVYIVFPLFESDLKNIIKTNVLSLDHMKYILYQILSSVYYLNSCSIIHRDLKPANFLMNSDCKITLCDFGLAKGANCKKDIRMSTFAVQTRWYRAPELLFQETITPVEVLYFFSFIIHRVILKFFTLFSIVEMWSIGCIFGEMILRLPLFFSESIVPQINKLLLVLGTPDKEDVYGIDSAKQYLFGLPFYYPPPDSELFPFFKDKDGLDLFHQMMNWNPYKRISTEEALKHPFFDDLRKESDFIDLQTFNESTFDDSFLDEIEIKGEKLIANPSKIENSVSKYFENVKDNSDIGEQKRQQHQKLNQKYKKKHAGVGSDKLSKEAKIAQESSKEGKKSEIC